MNSHLKNIYNQIKAGNLGYEDAVEKIRKFKAHRNNGISPSGNRIDGYNIIPEVYVYDEPYLKDHTVNNEQVLVGVTHASLAINTFFKIFPQETDVQLQRLNLVKPVEVRKNRSVEVLVAPVFKELAVEFQVLYRYASTEEWKVTATGRLNKTPFELTKLDISIKKDSLDEYHDIDRIYNRGSLIRLGESFKTISQLYSDTNQVLAKFVLTPASSKERHQYELHPLIANSAFLAAGALFTAESNPDTAFLPFGIKTIFYHRSQSLVNGWLLVTLAKNSGEIILFDAIVITDSSQIVAQFLGCSMKRVRIGDQPQRNGPSIADSTAFQPSDHQDSNRLPTEMPDSGMGSSSKFAAKIQKYLTQKLQKIAGNGLRSFSTQSNLMDLGLESSQLVELADEIESETQIELDPTLFFEFPNVKELTEYFFKEHQNSFLRFWRADSKKHENWGVVGQTVEVSHSKNAEEIGASGSSESSVSAISDMEAFPTNKTANLPPETRNLPDSTSKDIAVIGMHGVFADASNLDEFWRNIRDEKNLMKEVPIDHWDYRPWFDENPEAKDKTYCKWGSFIDNVDHFDAKFFSLSPREAEWMDPQVRLFLQSVYATGEDAGVINQLRGSSTGVFVGICCNDYSDRIVESNLPIDPYSATGVGKTAANRVSFWFDFTGPSLVIDTACSSSLFALHSACQSLRNKECNMAFVGGSNLLLASPHYRYFSSIKALSPTGRCHTFDEAADGYVPGEAVASILLKPLAQAEKDGNHIYAVIKGSAALHGGYTPSLTAPSVSGEENVILKAWENAGIHPESLSYIEAHGTGTRLGDPIELNSLKKAFKRFTNNGHFCAVGSVKANIGHAEGAAGIAGVLKVILQMKHQQIPALAQFKKLNPYVHLDKSALYVNQKLKHWENSETPRRAGVSSFGFSGSYAHAVIEEWLPPTENPTDSSNRTHQSYLIVLSARDGDRLQEIAKNLFAYITENCETETVSLHDLAYTLQVGREPMEKRVAFVVEDSKELVRTLGELKEGRKDLDDVFHGTVTSNSSKSELLLAGKAGKLFIKTLIQENDILRLGQLWVSGVEIDWLAHHGDNRPQLISLPTYPFAKERYWLPEPRPRHPSSNTRHLSPVARHPSWLHPLVQENTSSLSEQRFSSMFYGEEFFLADHVLGGFRVLPGVVHLEMARAAIGQAIESFQDGQTSIQLKNVVWTQPLVISDGSLHAHIRLMPEENGRITYEIYSDVDEAADDPSHSPPASEQSTKPRHLDTARGSELVNDNRLESQRLVHSQGYAILSSFAKNSPLDLSMEVSQCDQSQLSSNQFYGAFDSDVVKLGSRLRGIEEIYVGPEQILAKLSLPSAIGETKSDYDLHPSLMDSVFQVSISLLLSNSNRKPNLPFALQELEIHDKCTDTMWALARYSEDQSYPNTKIRKLDIDLCDEAGRICVRMKGLSARVMGGDEKSEGQQTTKGTLMLYPCWKEQVVPKDTVAPDYALRLVLLCEQKDISTAKIETEMSPARCITLKSQYIDVEKRFQSYAAQILEKIQSILRDKPKRQVLIQIVFSTESESRLFSGLSGMLKSAQIEHPNLMGQVIGIDSGMKLERIVETLLENSRSPSDNRIRYENGKRYIQRFEEFNLESDSPTRGLPHSNTPVSQHFHIPLKQHGTYLITGGAGGLGYLLAKEIAQKIKDVTLILVGRSPLNEKKGAQLKELEGMGSRAEYRQVDVTQKKAVIDLTQSIQEKFGSLQGIIHAAGVVQDSFILKKSKDELQKVLAPKVTGLVNLDQASAKISLDFFLLFSSGTGVLGGQGQVDYGCANAFMDSYSQYRNDSLARNQRQGQTLAINWPLWAEGGMTVDVTTKKILAQHTGMVPMLTSTGFRALYQSLVSDKDQMMVMEGDMPVMRRQLRWILNSTPQETPLRPSAHFISGEINTDSLKDNLQAALIKVVSKVLKTKNEEIDSDAEFDRFGFDSITFTELAQQLNQLYKLELTPTIFFEFSTLNNLADYLVKEYQSVFADFFKVTAKAEVPLQDTSSKEEQGKPKRHRRFASMNVQSGLETKSPRPESIAIVGMSGQFPMAEDFDDFWENLEKGRDCISEIPESRWDWRAFYGDPNREVNKTNVKWAGFIEGIDKFDPLFFGISPREAKVMDPQQRLLMTYVWKAIDDAGYSAQSLSGTRTAIFVGTSSSGYANLVSKSTAAIEGDTSTGLAPSVGPNRMSYFLNIHGPSEPIETACSSSLIAIHRGVVCIQTSGCDMAIVGGVNTILSPEIHISFSKAGMLCQDGRCKTFSNQANGYVRGEGVGMLLLKDLTAAEKAGDHIYGVIRGTAENHGGRANSLTAPNPKAQAELLKDAYMKSGIDLRTVTYIEAHGTGTELGDPIEINGLKSAFKELYEATGNPNIVNAQCGVGSVKTNIGHLELAAGIAGVIKVLLQLKHKKLAKSLHCDKINPYIQLKDSPFYIVQETQEWKPVKDGQGNDLPRRAGISSFGFGGANAHVVIEEYGESQTAEYRSNRPYKPHIVVLSAKNKDRLHEAAKNLYSYIQNWNNKNTNIQHPASSIQHLERLAYTLQVGRDAMEERMALTVKSLQELKDKLKDFLEGRDDIEDLYYGQMKKNKDTLAAYAGDEDMANTIDAWVRKGKYPKLLNQWVKGLVFDWKKLYGESKPRRISLPSYPFSRERYWIETKVDAERKNSQSNNEGNPALEKHLIKKEAKHLHPLEQEKTSDKNIHHPPVKVAIGVNQGTQTPETYVTPSVERSPLVPRSSAEAPLVSSVQTHKGKRSLIPSDSATLDGNIEHAMQKEVVELFDHGNGIFEIKMVDSSNQNLSLELVLADLEQSLQVIRNRESKVVLLTGDDHFFLADTLNKIEALDREKVTRLIKNCDIPVIAVMKGHGLGLNLLLGILCDFMIISEESRYQYHDGKPRWVPSSEEHLLVQERFGEDIGLLLLSSKKTYTGKELKRKGVRLPVLAHNQVDSHAMKMACELARCTKNSIVELKRHLAQYQGRQNGNLLSELVTSLDLKGDTSFPENGELNEMVGLSDWNEDGIAHLGDPAPVKLISEAVKVEAYRNGIVSVMLYDKANKNTFSQDLVQGIIEAFEHIRQNPKYKVIILSGYDHYFACGGTKESLLAVQDGSARFTDAKIYSLPLECEIPVIAAMQGHGIGAGWSMGLFCDLVVFSEESVYHCPYMKFGFTPGAGSTLIFPDRFGRDLGWEILFTAREYRGKELKARGIQLPVLPRNEVKRYAVKIAKQMALLPRNVLIDKKNHSCQSLRELLEEIYAKELAMHEKTFVRNPEVLEKIKQHFNDGNQEKEQESYPKTEVTGREPVEMDATMLHEIQGKLQDILAAELQMKPGLIEADMPFKDMGLDSIYAVSCTRRINDRFGLSIPASVVYRHPTLGQLASYIMEEGIMRKIVFTDHRQPLISQPDNPVKYPKHAVNEPRQIDPPLPIVTSSRPNRFQGDYTLSQSDMSASVKPIANHDKPQKTEPSAIAVIGMSGQFPMAADLNDYWRNIAEGKDCISEIPGSRWSIDAYYDPDPKVPQKTTCKWMGVLKDADKFDPLFFTISPREAELMDPQQRVFLQACWQCIEDSGYDPFGLSGSLCGVFVGFAGSDYSQLMNSEGLNALGFTGVASSILAARISYVLNLQGPCLTIDTACSSSLVAMSEACDSLTAGNSDLALAGGVCIMAGPGVHIMASKAGMLSPDGRCFAFDQRANGFVPGEGVGVVLLKRLDDARRDRDRIYGMIRGWGVNQDGKSNGITAPNPNSQKRLEQAIYKKFSINPAGIQLVEAHGTGTSLGDPMEIEALTESFQGYTQKENYCALGSVKSNIGHLAAAAGVAGAIKLLLALQHRKLPPTIHHATLNEHIDLEHSPFYINTECKEWNVSTGGKRRAAVSSFGFSGTNAHMVIEEYLEGTKGERQRAGENDNRPALIILSAKNKDRLKDIAKNLHDYLQNQIINHKFELLNLNDLAYTLQIGRHAMEERLAMIVQSIEILKEKLKGYLDGDDGVEHLYQGRVKRDKDALALLAVDEDMAQTINTWIAKGKYAKLLQLWVKGMSIDWKKLYGESVPCRISLPTYPFAKERYWIEEKGLKDEGQNAKENPHQLGYEILSGAQTSESFSGPGLQLNYGLVFMTPVWNPISEFKTNPLVPKVAGQIVVVGGSKKEKQAIRKQYPGAHSLEIRSENDASQLVDALRALGPIHQLVWITPNYRFESVTDESLIQAQNYGVVHLFRLVKTLLSLEYGLKELTWTVITRQTRKVQQTDSVIPAHAAVHGLIESMAKEYPNWKIRVLDMEDAHDWPISEMFRIPLDVQNSGFAYRNKEWFQQTLIQVQGLSGVQSRYRSKGVYVVIGGAGGIGKAWSESIVDKYQANLVWFGRRKKDKKIEKDLNSLSKFGPAPIYIQADATNKKSLQNAYDEIKKIHPQIHGVIHSAIVLWDKSLAKMSEEEFREALTAKIDVSVHLPQIFQKESLDFVLFFSSMIAFGGAAGQSNYAAGCTFKDAFAHRLAKDWPCSVKVMNWGYWGNVGIVKDPSYNERMSRAGLGSIEPQEGMRALDILLECPLDQMALIKTLDPMTIPGMSSNESMTIYQETLSSHMDTLKSHLPKQEVPEEILKFAESGQYAEMEKLMLLMLYSSLQSIGVIEAKTSISGEVSVKGNLQKGYARWLEESIRVLRTKGFLHFDGVRDTIKEPSTELSVLWKKWDTAKVRWLKNPDQKAQVILVEPCLRNLPAILSGKKKATDILFPNSSLKLVEGIYKQNLIADHFNEILATTVIAYVQDRISQDPSTQIRILEIGAGTGGTTTALLPKLHPFQRHILEYRYTDVSKAFLLYADEHFAPDNPYLTTQFFDVSESPGEQNFPSDCFDLVIAANVLHATKNIRETLQNAKATMRKNGLLFLIEVSQNTLFNHLTVGLLEGWWLYEDPQLRMQGCPGLTAETWKNVLESEGLLPVFFPAQQLHEMGQQILIAESDGVIRKKNSFIRDNSSKFEAIAEKPLPTKRHPLPKDCLRERTIAFLKEMVGETVKMSSQKIDSSEPLETYGIDSIMLGQLNQHLSKEFAGISSTLLFEHQTIEALAKHFMETQKEALTKQFGISDLERHRENSTDIEMPRKAHKNNVNRTLKRPGRFLTPHKIKGNGEYTPPSRNAIAIIGMSGRYPQAETLNEYWDNLKAGKSSITEIPKARWDWKDYYHANPRQAPGIRKTYSKWGGFLDGFSLFDPFFFNMTPREAENIDPQERIFLEECWKAFEDAGYAPSKLSPELSRKTGVFGGITKLGFSLLSSDSPHELPMTSFASLVNRVSYHLNLNGPSLPVDTMCSSSLVAIHEACEYLRRGGGELAIVGGVNGYAHPSTYIALAKGQFISNHAHTPALQKGGMGFVPGEGVGAVILKPYENALRDGDSIYALIRGSAVNHGGKGNSYTMSNPIHQAAVIQQALEQGDIDPRTISYIEAAANGSEMGDAIEMNALTNVFGQRQGVQGDYKIGSVKPSIGHCESASGISQLTKAVLSLKHKTLVPTLIRGEWNPNINFDQLPFRLQQEVSEWKPVIVDGETVPRRAGITSIGGGGVNAHIIVEEYCGEEKSQFHSIQYHDLVLFILSAKNLDRLEDYARKWITYLQSNNGLDLIRIGYTLQVGREEMPCRLAIIIHRQEDLINALGHWCEHHESSDCCFFGDLTKNKIVTEEVTAQAIEIGKLSELGKLWVLGNSINWNSLYRDKPLIKMSNLPTYPFQRKQCWIVTHKKQKTKDETNDAVAEIDDEVLGNIVDRIAEGELTEEQVQEMIL